MKDPFENTQKANNRDKIFAIHISAKGVVSRIYNEFSKLKSQKTKPNRTKIKLERGETHEQTLH